MDLNSLKNSATEFARDLGSLRGVVFIVGKICLIAAVAFAYNIGTALANLNKQELPPLDYGTETLGDDTRVQAPLEKYAVVSRRNIFGVKEKETNTSQPAPVSKLSLRLVGTNVTTGTKPFAIIEDTTKKDQDIFELNEMIFSQAKLLEVAADRVKISHNGQTETLVLEDGENLGGGDSTTVESNAGQTEFTVAESELNDAMANLPVLLSQARAVPYFKNGESVGMRLFAIRRDSLYEKLGLKNGDILKAVNDNPLTDPAQALKLFEQLKSERSISVRVERNGQDTTLRYDIR